MDNIRTLSDFPSVTINGILYRDVTSLISESSKLKITTIAGLERYYDEEAKEIVREAEREECEVRSTHKKAPNMSKEQREEIIRLYNLGVRRRAIADRVGVNHGQVESAIWRYRMAKERENAKD